MKPYCMYEKSLLHLLLLNAEVQKRQRDLKHLRSSTRHVYQLCSSSIQIFQLPSDWPCNALRLCIHLLISTQSTDLLHITPLIANLCQFHNLIPDFQPGIYFISLFVSICHFGIYCDLGCDQLAASVQLVVCLATAGSFDKAHASFVTASCKKRSDLHDC